MGVEELKFEIKQGGPELQLEDEPFNSLLESYEEQFVRQLEAGEITKDQIKMYLSQALKDVGTQVLVYEGNVVGMGSVHKFRENPDFPNNDIIELNTLVVPKNFRGKGFSEEIIESLQAAALSEAKRNGRGLISTLITANPIVAHQAGKKKYTERSLKSWEALTGLKTKPGYMERYGYKPFVNEEHLYRDPRPVNNFRIGIKDRVLSLLSRFKR